MVFQVSWRWSKVISVHKRFEDFVMNKQELYLIKINSDHATALQYYLSHRGNGLLVESPAVRIMMSFIVNDPIELIGNTIHSKVKSFDTGSCNLYLQLEPSSRGGL